jgi:uncharacterized nucleotidyltransferase DUF6036
MQRDQLEHVIGAAANVLGEDDFVVIGSQAILGPHPDAPPALLRSMEVDLYPKEAPERAAELDGSLGDGSRFHETYGYYAHGVGPETAAAPAGWQERLIEIEISARVGSGRRPVAFFLEPHDLVLAKCAAGRDRDWDFAKESVKAGLVDPPILLSRVDDLPVDKDTRALIRRQLEGIARVGEARPSGS